ncbi:hypothetical protein BD770DRAFT_298783, partial [Pilaira anomala]
LSLQETHANPTSIPSLDIQFQAQQTFWTPNCGIISFSTDYILTKITTDMYFTSDRFILCKVHHPHNFYHPFYVLNIYAPSDSNTARRTFFESLGDMLFQMIDTISWDNLIISGDFNYDFYRDIQSGKGLFKTSQQWIAILQNSFYNSML